MPIVRAGILIATAIVGVLVALIFRLEEQYTSQWYLSVALGLLAVGLYGSTSGIDLAELRTNLRIVVLAVTVGVLLKVLLIALAMLAFFGKPEYLLLGIAVAQIDPLSVAALRRESRMSPAAKSILSAWSSFDDPVTVLLTIYVSGYILSTPIGNAGIGSFAGDLALNALLALVAFILWVTFSPARRKKVAATVRRRPPVRTEPKPMPVTLVVVAGILVACGLWIAIQASLMLGVALVGLFLRPPERFMPLLDGAVQGALYAATLALGIVLANGVQLVPGIVLGVLAFTAQILVGLLLTVGRTKHDRVSLALSQQNGLTAIVLALVLQPVFPSAVAVIAPAIVVVALLYAVSNVKWRRIEHRHRDPVPTSVITPG